MLSPLLVYINLRNTDISTREVLKENKMSMIVVREADPLDTESIVSLMTTENDNLNYPIFETIDRIAPEITKIRVEARMAAEDLSVVVATIDSEVVGTGYLTEEGHISATYVKTPKRGVAKALLKARIKKAKELGLTHITMAVYKENTKLLKLAKSLGFVPASDEEETPVMLIKSLT